MGRFFFLFAGKASLDDHSGSGDVKYHLGASTSCLFGEISLQLSLVANPSHLVSVNPVVLGQVRAKQRQFLKKGTSWGF